MKKLRKTNTSIKGKGEEVLPVKKDFVISGDKVASDIEELYFQSQSIVKQAGDLLLNNSIKIGELLLLKKEEVEHGTFLPWIKSELPFNERQAQKYMRIYQNKDKLLSLFKTGADEAFKNINSMLTLLSHEPKQLPRTKNWKGNIVESCITDFSKYLGKIEKKIGTQLSKKSRQSLEEKFEKLIYEAVEEEAKQKK